jgi:hypothetical protein
MPVTRVNGQVNTEATAINYINDSQNSFKLRNRRDKAQLNQDFERGDQWDAEEWDIYKSKGVDPVTVNECRPAIKGLVGMQMQDQQEIRVRPRKNATESSAAVYTELLNHTQDLAYSDYKYTELFKQGMTDPEAFIAVHIDKRANINGQPQFKVYGQKDVDVDPNSHTYDLSGNEGEHEGAEFVILKDWVPIEWLQKKYPDKAGDIEKNVNVDPTLETNMNSLVERIAQWAYDSGTQFIDDDEFGNEDNDKTLRDRYRYRMYTVFWRETINAAYVSDRQTGLTKRFTGKEASKFRRLGKKSQRFEVENDVGKRLHRTVTLGNVMELETKVDPFGDQISDYPVFRFSTFWKDGKASAFLDDIVQLNREKNIHRTQGIKILNNNANTGWITDGGSKAMLNNLANYGAVDGVVLNKADYGGGIKKIEPNTLPAAHYTYDQTFSSDLERVSGIDETTKGLSDDKNQSGRAKFLQDTSNKRSSSMIITHNFYHTLELLGVFLLKMIRFNNIYTPAEIRQVVSESTLITKENMDKARRRLEQRTGAALPEPKILPPVTPELMMGIRPEDQTEVLETVQAGTEAATEYLKEYPRLAQEFEDIVKEEAIDMLVAELKDDGAAEYGVKVSLSPSTPTAKLSALAGVEAAATTLGVPVPPEVVIDLLDIQPDLKDQWKAGIAQQAQLQQAG